MSQGVGWWLWRIFPWLVVRETGAQLHSSANTFISTVDFCACVCGRFTTKMLHYCCKSVSSFNASFLASLFSASIYCNTRDFGSRKICQSPVARVDILMISCVFWVVRCDRICVWVCLSSSAVCVCVISIDLVIPDQALCGLHPSLYFA